MSDQNLPDPGDSLPIYRLPVGKQLDPLKYRRKTYVLNVTCEVAVGDVGRGQVTIDDNPFMWTKTTVGLQDVDANAQDNQYLVEIRDSNRYYENEPARPDLLFGNVFQGGIIPFDVATFLDSTSTLYVEVTNLQARQGETFIVQFCFIGFERWKE